jgi:hypothetical protein
MSDLAAMASTTTTTTTTTTMTTKEEFYRRRRTCSVTVIGLVHKSVRGGYPGHGAFHST